MGQVEEIGDGSQEGNDDAEVEVQLVASGAADCGKVQKERVDEEGEDAGDEEDTVPLEDHLAAGVEDAAAPRGGGAAEADRRLHVRRLAFLSCSIYLMICVHGDQHF